MNKISPDVKINNKGGVYFDLLDFKDLPVGIIGNNVDSLYLKEDKSINKNIKIEGINIYRMLSIMNKQGIL